MNVEIGTFLIWCGVAFALGWGAASIIGFQISKDSKGVHMKLTKESNRNWWGVLKSVMYILVAVAFIATVVQSVTFTYHQRECNAAVVERIKFGADLTAENQRLNDSKAEALKKLVDTLISSSAIQNDAARTEVVKVSFAEYQATIRAIDTKRAENEQKRAESPYPDCS